MYALSVLLLNKYICINICRFTVTFKTLKVSPIKIYVLTFQKNTILIFNVIALMMEASPFSDNIVLRIVTNNNHPN